MTPAIKDSFRVTLNRELVELDACKDHLAIFLHNNKLNEELTSAVELAVYEALVNIYDHESKKFKEKPIIVDCEMNDEQIVTKLTYEGNKFDLTKAILPDIVLHFKQGKKRGLGIYFIRTLMDKVDYSTASFINMAFFHTRSQLSSKKMP